MKIVIDIPDEVAKENTPKAYFEYFGAWSSNLTKAFETAVVLPEGHGDLIDRDETMRTWGNKYFYQGIPLENYIDEVPAIIPADNSGAD